MLHCQLPVERGGLNGRAIYVYTEGRPATKRIGEERPRLALLGVGRVGLHGPTCVHMTDALVSFLS